MVLWRYFIVKFTRFHVWRCCRLERRMISYPGVWVLLHSSVDTTCMIEIIRYNS